MGAGWVGGVSRSKALLSRCLGAEGARRLAASASHEDALRQLSATAYRRFLTPGGSLPQAQRAVSEVLLWHMRVLAGWLPRAGTRALRGLAAGFEVSNTEDLLRSFSGTEAPSPYRLGALATAWGRLGVVRSPGQLRTALTRSAWGDPGGEDPATLAVSLRMAAAAQVQLHGVGRRSNLVASARRFSPHLLVIAAACALVVK